MHSRFATCRRPDHGDGDAARVEESAGHGAVELGRGHVLVLGNIMNPIDEGRASTTVSGRVSRDLGCTDGKSEGRSMTDERQKVVKLTATYPC